MQKIDVAAELGACVKALGGVLLDDRKFPDGVRKADYWFPDDNVVAELKVLSEDLAADDGFRERILTMHESWVKRRLIRPRADGRVIVKLQDLPETCAHEFLNYLKRRFESNVIGRANGQIYDTKAHLGVTDARGLLVVANDADSLCPPEMFAHLLARSTRGKINPEIHSTIFFAANLPASVRDTNEQIYYWVDGLTGRPPASKRIRDELRGSWIKRHSEFLGDDMPARHHQGDEGRELFERLHYPLKRATPPRRS